MDLLVALLGIAAMAGGLVAFAWFVLGRQVEHLRGMFRADELGWPRGVQEEDPAPTWNVAGLSVAGVGSLDDDRAIAGGAPARVRVEPQLGRGSSRRGGRW
ncbi:MAG: hypothetical protein ACJ77B_09635 [Chloroflexota bacterium]